MTDQFAVLKIHSTGTTLLMAGRSAEVRQYVSKCYGSAVGHLHAAVTNIDPFKEDMQELKDNVTTMRIRANNWQEVSNFLNGNKCYSLEVGQAKKFKDIVVYRVELNFDEALKNVI